MMYVTPVIYPISMLGKYPVIKTLMLWLNPIALFALAVGAQLVRGRPVTRTQRA